MQPRANSEEGFAHVSELTEHANATGHYGGHGFAQQASMTKPVQAGDGVQPEGADDGNVGDYGTRF